MKKSLVNDRRLYDLILAVPNSNECVKVVVILGAAIYSTLFMDGMIKAKDNSSVAQETKVGWILSEPVGESKLNDAVCMVATTGEIDQELQMFWKWKISMSNESSREKSKIV